MIPACLAACCWANLFSAARARYKQRKVTKWIANWWALDSLPLSNGSLIMSDEERETIATLSTSFHVITATQTRGLYTRLVQVLQCWPYPKFSCFQTLLDLFHEIFFMSIMDSGRNHLRKMFLNLLLWKKIFLTILHAFLMTLTH